MIALNEMMESQNKLNILTMGDKWSSMNLNWRLAVVQESSELIDSFPYKWWKNADTNIENAKIEIVDVWHFVLSLMLEANIVPTKIMEAKFIALSEASPLDINDNIDELMSYAMNLISTAINSNSIIEIAESVMLLSGKIGFTYGDMIKIYFGKAVLNRFRQLNGYSEGTYIKNWEGVEDNEVMLRHIRTIDYSVDFSKTLFENLTEEYIAIAA